MITTSQLSYNGKGWLLGESQLRNTYQAGERVIAIMAYNSTSGLYDGLCLLGSSSSPLTSQRDGEAIMALPGLLRMFEAIDFKALNNHKNELIKCLDENYLYEAETDAIEAAISTICKLQETAVMILGYGTSEMGAELNEDDFVYAGDLPVLMSPVMHTFLSNLFYKGTVEADHGNPLHYNALEEGFVFIEKNVLKFRTPALKALLQPKKYLIQEEVA